MNDLTTLLRHLGGRLEIVPLGLSRLSQEKITHLKAKGFDILAPLPPSARAMEQAVSLALQNKFQAALNAIAQSVGEQIARRYAQGGAHIRTGALATELLRATWIARKG